MRKRVNLKLNNGNFGWWKEWENKITNIKRRYVLDDFYDNVITTGDLIFWTNEVKDKRLKGSSWNWRRIALRIQWM